MTIFDFGVAFEPSEVRSASPWSLPTSTLSKETYAETGPCARRSYATTLMPLLTACWIEDLIAAESWALITMTLTPFVIIVLTCWAWVAALALALAYWTVQPEQSSLTFASKYGLSNFSYRAVTLSGRSRPIEAFVPPPEELELLSDFLSSPALPQAAIETAIVVAITATAARRIRVFTLKPP